MPLLPEVSMAKVRWLLTESGEDSIFEDLPFGPPQGGNEDDPLFEHFLHEVAHGQSLNLGPFTPTTSHSVGLMLGGFRDEGRHEEARVWAVEWTLWPKLGLAWGWGELLDQADIQGVHEEDIKPLLGDPRTREVAERTFQEVLRLVGCPPA